MVCERCWAGGGVGVALFVAADNTDALFQLALFVNTNERKLFVSNMKIEENQMHLKNSISVRLLSGKKCPAYKRPIPMHFSFFSSKETINHRKKGCPAPTEHLNPTKGQLYKK